MSIASVTRTVRVGGVLADVAAGAMTCVVTRADTSAIVSNTATHPSVGIYTFTVDNPADVTYYFTITTIYDGIPYVDVITVLPQVASSNYNRISARRGQKVDLDTTFYQGGRRADPYAIYRVEIFRGKVATENIVDAIDIPSDSGTGTDSTNYPYPLVRPPNAPAANTNCPTPPNCTLETEVADSSTGKFRLVWDVPSDAIVPDVYFDVWYFYSTNPGSPLSNYESSLLKQCNRFWVYPDDWYADGGLQTIRFGFEPLDIKFRKPESRPLEVGIMPLPLYDYDYNLVAPIIPYLSPTISIWTDNAEPVITNATCQIKLRQGAFRTNPWVISYNLDTCGFFIGTYKYRVKVMLPDGSTRVSGDFYFTVS